MIRVGFVLLTHSQPRQILRLVRSLNELYDGPPIACHHDFGQCPLDQAEFPKNVLFVSPHFSTFWGCFAIVPAALAGIRLLVQNPNPPDWIYLLSGSDYPCAPPDIALRTLAQTACDAFIDHREITYAGAAAAIQDPSASGFSRPAYVALAYRRYCAVAIPRPSRNKPWAFPPVGRVYLRHPRWRSILPAPFSDQFRCFAGEHWFTANARAAAVLTTETSQSMRLLSYLHRRESPEECFYHSLLGNSSLNLNSNHLRYIDWPTSDAWHPKMLTLADLPAIRASGAHFARKVPHNSPLVPELDSLIGLSTARLANIG